MVARLPAIQGRSDPAAAQVKARKRIFVRTRLSALSACVRGVTYSRTRRASCVFVTCTASSVTQRLLSSGESANHCVVQVIMTILFFAGDVCGDTVTFNFHCHCAYLAT